DRARARDLGDQRRLAPVPRRREAQEGLPVMNEQTTNILVDTALASGSASALDPEERRLQELVLTVRDDAPVPSSDFELRMNARVAAGFPPRRSDRLGRVRALLATRPQMAAMGAAASVLIGPLGALSGANPSGTR